MIRPARVLVVDDDAAVLEAMESLLAVAGHQVVTACEGRAALRWLAETLDPPDIIFLDLDMPVMNGRAFLREYRTSASPRAPVVVVTGSSDLSGLDEAVLRKPVVPRTILELVERAHLLEEEQPLAGNPPAIPDA